MYASCVDAIASMLSSLTEVMYGATSSHIDDEIIFNSVVRAVSIEARITYQFLLMVA